MLVRFSEGRLVRVKLTGRRSNATELPAFLGAMQQNYGSIINVRFWAAVYEEA